MNKTINTFNFYVKTKNDLINAIDKFGFVPLFSNFIKGFSVEENVSPEAWWNYTK